MLAAVRRENVQVRRYFYEEVKKLNMEFIPSETSFVMFNAKRSSLEMISAFKGHQILIGRPIPSLPQHVRISLGTREEMKVFFNVLKKIV